MDVEKVTLFYLKINGIIKYYCSGEQSMEYFGPNAEAKAQTIDFVIVDNNKDIIRNYRDYRVNLTSKVVEHI